MYNIKRGKITQYLLCALHIISTQEKSLYLSSSLSYAVALSSLLYLVYRFVLCDLWMYNVKTSAHVLCVKNYILHCFQGHFFADVNSNTHVDIDLLFSFLGWEKNPSDLISELFIIGCNQIPRKNQSRVNKSSNLAVADEIILTRQ